MARGGRARPRPGGWSVGHLREASSADGAGDWSKGGWVRGGCPRTVATWSWPATDLGPPPPPYRGDALSPRIGPSASEKRRPRKRVKTGVVGCVVLPGPPGGARASEVPSEFVPPHTPVTLKILTCLRPKSVPFLFRVGPVFRFPV